MEKIETPECDCVLECEHKYLIRPYHNFANRHGKYFYGGKCLSWQLVNNRNQVLLQLDPGNVRGMFQDIILVQYRSGRCAFVDKTGFHVINVYRVWDDICWSCGFLNSYLNIYLKQDDDYFHRAFTKHVVPHLNQKGVIFDLCAIICSYI